MDKITVISSYAAPLPMPGINTDIISPMKRNISPCDMGHYAFEPIRYLNGDGDLNIPDPSFPLNRKPYINAKILLVGENFGCGSSRETAALGIALMGIKCIIGSSFGGIFMRNCYQQGILPVSLDTHIIEEMFKQTERGRFTVDLLEQVITTPDKAHISFEIETFRKNSLVNGLDMISSTLCMRADIVSFENKTRTDRPWIF